MIIDINSFIKGFDEQFPLLANTQPWEITSNLTNILQHLIFRLKHNPDYHIENEVAVHKTAIIETGVVLKGPIIMEKNCFVAAHAYLRGGVYLDNNVTIGSGCELKSSLIFQQSAIAHFNYIGDSIIGCNVNFEAGAIAANHFNERADKKIAVYYNSETLITGAAKFGALVGDGSRIGANAVLSPGTILEKKAIVRRLELIEQVKGSH